MILDTADQLASATALTTTTGTNPVGVLYIDRLASMDDGKGADVCIHARVSTAFTSANSTATVQFVLQGNATDPTFASGNVALYTGTATVVTGLPVNTEIIRAKIQRGPNTRYIRLAAVILVEAITAGAVDCWLLNDDEQDNTSYPAGYTVA